MYTRKYQPSSRWTPHIDGPLLEASIHDFQDQSLEDRLHGKLHSAKLISLTKSEEGLNEEANFTMKLPKERVLSLECVFAGCRAVLWFPLSLHVSIGRGCTPDIQIRAFQFLTGAPLESLSSWSAQQKGWLWNLRRSVGLIGRLTAMTAIRFCLPSVIPALQRALCLSSFLSIFLKMTPFFRRQQSQQEPQQNSVQSGPLISWEPYCFQRFWVELSTQIHTWVLVSTLTGELWTVFHPRSQHLAECSIVLLEIDRNYKQLAKKIAKGKIVGTARIEQAWLDTHKAAAQKVAHLQRDLPDSAPLKKLIECWERTQIQVGRRLPDSYLLVQSLQQTGSFSVTWNLAPSPSRQDSTNASGLRKKTLVEVNEFPLEEELDLMMSDEEVRSEEGDELRLYGEGDHEDPVDGDPLTPMKKCQLSVRGIQLLLAFLPFLLLGLFLLLMAYVLDSQTANTRGNSSARIRPNLDPTKKKNVVNQMRLAAFERLLQGCRDGGAAFIKWGQWSSSREDLFPLEFCDVLSELHDQAPVHSIKQTKKEIQRAYGRPLEEVFESFDYQPLASGSVAQVHKAIYKTQEGELIPVIVKVRHPNVGVQIEQDFQILKPLAGLAEKIPTLKNLPLKESVSQFSSTMTAQTDFRVEAAHMERFWQNFLPVKDSIVIPKVIPELVTESVLVESYEEGRSVSHFIKNPSALNTKIVTLGVDAYLKMLLSDNFVHTDLHPGNIMVREREMENEEKKLQIVLLDFGLAEKLKPNVRKHFISFLNMISKGDGYSAAQHLLRWSENQNCPNPAAFIEDMHGLFTTHCDIQSEEGIDLDLVMKSVLRLSRKHHVSIDSCYASLVIGVCIIVGFAQALDPRVNLMDAATPVLLAYALTGRVVGRLYG